MRHLFVILLAVICLVSFFEFTYAQSPYDRLKDRYDNDEDFRLLAQFIIGTLICALILSVLAGLVGLRQSVLWAFIGGFFGTGIINAILPKFIGVGFGVFSFALAFIVGITCAVYVQVKSNYQ